LGEWGSAEELLDDGELLAEFAVFADFCLEFFYVVFDELFEGDLA
jgi:hypothetical protein